MKNTTNNKTKYKKLAQFIELFIWFLLLVCIVGIGIVTKHNYNQYKTYKIFLQDVDGIIKGSPVRMMGIHIGYVRKVKIINDMVFVDFIINQIISGNFARSIIICWLVCIERIYISNDVPRII